MAKHLFSMGEALGSILSNTHTYTMQKEDILLLQIQRES